MCFCARFFNLDSVVRVEMFMIISVEVLCFFDVNFVIVTCLVLSHTNDRTDQTIHKDTQTHTNRHKR